MSRNVRYGSWTIVVLPLLATAHSFMDSQVLSTFYLAIRDDLNNSDIEYKLDDLAYYYEGPHNKSIAQGRAHFDIIIIMNFSDFFDPGAEVPLIDSD